MKLSAFLLLLLSTPLAGCQPVYQKEGSFETRAGALIKYASDVFQVPPPDYSDPEKVYWPVTISRFQRHGTADSLGNTYIEQFRERAPFHFIYVGMARLMPLFPEAPAMSRYRLQYLRNVRDRTDSYNPWTGEGTENHINMNRTSGYLYAEWMEEDPVEFPMAASWKARMKEWIAYYSRRIFETGTGEFNASTYGVYNIIGWLNLYDFAEDPEVRQMARAVLDYYASEVALHHLQGMTAGAESRGAPSVFSCRNETDYLAWLWFGDAPGKVDADFFRDDRYNPPLPVVHAATSRYRPPHIAVKLARKELTAAAWYRNSKGTYLLDHPSYIKHFLFTDSVYALGAACYPYGAFASSTWKNTTWKLVSRVEPGKGRAAQMITGGGLFYPDLEGKVRNPWLQVIQHRNILIQLNRMPVDAPEIVTGVEQLFREWKAKWESDFILRFSAGDEKITSVGNPVKFQRGGRTSAEGNGCYIWFPAADSHLIRDRVLFLELEQCYVAVRSLHLTTPQVVDGCRAFDRAPAGQLSGLILEADRSGRYTSFENFVGVYLDRTSLTRDFIRQDSLVYTGLEGTVIQARYGHSGSFSEPIYDWGFGPDQPQVIPTSPPYLQPSWPAGEGHGRLAMWYVNGIPEDLEAGWPVYGGPDLTVENGILELRDLNNNTYRVDYTRPIPMFFRNGESIQTP